jgi:lysozyme
MKNLIESIKKNEGYVPTVYKDSLGIDTIGYGFAIKDLKLDEDVCDIILNRKLALLLDRINNKFNWFKYMPPEIKDVVVEMCYQMGVYGFSCFKKTIAYLQDKQWEKASEEMLDSRWAIQTPNRAQRMSDIVKGFKDGK